MIGFISAISASLAIIILVVIASLIGYVQSILPTKGLIKISDVKYRYVMEGKFVNDVLVEEVILQIENIGISNRVTSYQTACNYGFNTNEREMLEVSTYNYLVISQYFDEVIQVGLVKNVENQNSINTCYIDINLREKIS